MSKPAGGLGDRIRRVRRQRGLTQRELAARLGVTLRSVQNYEEGREPGARALRAMERELGVDLNWLLGGEGRGAAGGRVPLYGSVPAGGLAEPGDTGVVGHLLAETVYRGCFGLVVKGDSMAPFLLDGDRVVVAPTIEHNPGDVVVVEKEGEYTLKRVSVQEGMLILMPENPGYEPVVIREGEESDVRVAGVVVEVVRRLR